MLPLMLTLILPIHMQCPFERHKIDIVENGEMTNLSWIKKQPKLIKLFRPKRPVFTVFFSCFIRRYLNAVINC